MDYDSYYPNWPAVERLFERLDSRPDKFSKLVLAEIANLDRSMLTNKLNGTRATRPQRATDRLKQFEGLKNVLAYIDRQEPSLLVRDSHKLALEDFLIADSRPRSRRTRPIRERNPQIHWLPQLEGPLADEWKKLFIQEFGYYGQAEDEFVKIVRWLKWSEKAVRKVGDEADGWLRFILGGAYTAEGRCMALASCAIDLVSGFVYVNYVALADASYLGQLQEIDFDSWVEKIRLECERVMHDAIRQGNDVADHLTFVYEVDRPPQDAWKAILSYDAASQTPTAMSDVDDDDLVHSWAALRRLPVYFDRLNSRLVCGNDGPLAFDFWWPKAADRFPKPTPSWWMVSGTRLRELESPSGVRRVRDFMYDKSYNALVSQLVPQGDPYWRRVGEERKKVVAASTAGTLDHTLNAWAELTPLRRSFPMESVYDAAFRVVRRELRLRGIDGPTEWDRLRRPPQTPDPE